MQQKTLNQTELTTMKHSLKKEQRKLLIRQFSSSKLTVVGVSVFSFLILFVIIGALAVPFAPNEVNIQNRLQTMNSVHWFGTDDFGRDLLSRVIYGGQVSLFVGFVVTLASSIFGLIIGLYASYYRMLDSLIMRINDAIIAFPAILLAIALMAAMGASIQNVIIALTVTFTPYIARVVRSSALVVREETYIEAIHAQGASSWRIIWLHIAPNTLSPLIVQATFIFAQAIIIEAALSFLGAGVPAPDPSWGSILSDGKTHIYSAWWIILFPGVFMVLAVLSLNLLGDGLRDVLDPHSTGTNKK